MHTNSESLTILGSQCRQWPSVVILALLLAACSTSGGTTTTGETNVDPTTTAHLQISTTVREATTSTTFPTTGLVVSSVNEGRVLFTLESSDGNGTASLAYIDDTGLHEIANGGDLTLQDAVWAGDDVVFSSEQAGNPHLFRVSINGADVTQITGTPDTLEGLPGTTPNDGGWVVYELVDTQSGQHLGLTMARLDGTGSVRLTPEGVEDLGGSFSPDGLFVVFRRGGYEEATDPGLYIVNVETGEERLLIDGELDPGYPRWSPDGSTIMFTTNYFATTGDEIWTVPAQGGEPSFLIEGAEGDWSPDGTEIVFRYWTLETHNNELRIASADGTNERTIWVGPNGDAAPQPNGTTPCCAWYPDWGE